MGLLANAFSLLFGGKALSVQNPLPTNQASIHPSDIDFDNSVFTDWAGDPAKLFESPFSDSIVNSTGNNPKVIILAFKRTVSAVQFGFGENNGGDFSNIKISLLGSEGVTRDSFDDSLNDTKRNSLNAEVGDELFNSLKIEFFTADEVSLSNITIQKAAFNVIGNNVNNPVATDGDSVYPKDIDLLNSIMGNFSGSAFDFFRDLHSENIDNTANNPKLLTIHFKRTIITPLIGIGSSEGGNFSNVKIIGILSGGFELTLADFSGNSTLRTSQNFPFPNAGVNAIRFEFNTANTISITNIFITKLRAVATISETPIKYATSYKSPYLLNGGSQDMNIAGATPGLPIDFEYEVTGVVSAKWYRSFIDLSDGAQNFAPGDFGAIANGLVNGVQIIVVKSGVETIMETWKTNMDISMTCYDFSSPFKVGAYVGRWTLSSDIGTPVTLFPGDKIIARLQDTEVSDLDSFRFRVKLSQ